MAVGAFEAASGTAARVSSVTGFGPARPGDDLIGLEQMLAGTEVIDGILVASPMMRKVMRMTALMGPYKTSVLIEGESGTGKELVARALHSMGPAPDGPFVTFNCSNLVESLAEHIAMLILGEFGVDWVSVVLSKPGAIRGSRDVGVALERGRASLDEWRQRRAG